MVERIAYRLVVHRGVRAVAVLGQDRWLRFRVVSVLLALLLLASAVLKTHELATQPPLGTGMLESRWLIIALIQFELLLASWLASGIAERPARYVAIGTFSLFAVMTAGKALAGESTCGCFGRLPTSPWLVLAMDLSAVTALCCTPVRFLRSSGPRTVSDNTVSRVRREVAVSHWKKSGVVLAFVWLPAAICLGYLSVRGPRADAIAGVGYEVGKIIVLEPDRMVGERFRLSEYIDIGNELIRGRWLVVLYRAGCPDCELLMTQYLGSANELSAGYQTAFVAVGNDSRKPKLAQSRVCWGRLADDIEWVVATPLVMCVAENRVLEVRGEANLRPARRHG